MCPAKTHRAPRRNQFHTVSIIDQLLTRGTMDWTGGVRRRYAAGKNNASLLKQKQHFARARAAQAKNTSSRVTVVPTSPGISSRSPRQNLAVQQRAASRIPREMANSSGHDAPLMDRTSEGILPWDRCANQSLPLHSTPGPTIKAPVRPPVQYGRTLSDEERLLLARRQRLLERHDWVGLAATRPVHLDFRSEQDKDRVGKRRKISRSTKDAKTTGRQRPLPPLFEQRLPGHDHFMSGVLLGPEIRVKVGTEALASQTQVSSRSHTPVNTSLRPLSTQQTLLSENSMLLGSEDADFSAAQIAAPIDVPLMVPLNDRGHLTGVTQDSNTEITARTESPGHPQIIALPHGRLQLGGHPAGTPAYQPSCPIPGKPTPTSPFIAGDGSLEGFAIRQHTRAGSMTSPSRLPHVQEDTGGKPQDRIDDDTDCDGDGVWRRILDIQGPGSSRHSVKALKSSSRHITGSSSSRRPVLDPPALSHIDETDTASTPKGAGTLGTLGMSQSADESGSASPSTSLAQWQRLADLPPQPPVVAEEAANSEDERDNALWRAFIIGRDDGSDSVFRHVYEDVPRRNEPRLSKQSGDSPIKASDKDDAVSTLFNTESGLGSSAQATQGETMCLELSELARSASSHAASAEKLSKPSTNIHAIENGKRSAVYRPLQPHGKALLCLDTEVGRSQQKRSRPRLDHSIYDLVDSDGVSLYS